MRSLPSAVLVLLACVLATLSGCGSLPRLVARDESERRAAHLQNVQLKVMRYADDYSARITDPLVALTLQPIAPEARLLAHDWRIQQSTAAYTIASGPNPIINALDMIVLATLSRMVVEDQVSRLDGFRASNLLEIHAELERQSWGLVAGTLNDEQCDELKALIMHWRREHPQMRAISQIRFADFASIGKQNDGSTQSSNGAGVFERIGLDPLSNLDPAVRELEQTRLLAERTIYYLQRSPSLLEMQVERLAYQLAITPEAKQSLAGMERVSFGVEALGKLSADAPALIASERHALIAEMTASLHQQQEGLQALLAQANEVLQSGTRASDSVGATVLALDGFVGRLQKGSGGSADSTSRRPFDINEYAQTARELATAAQDLHTLLVQVDASAASAEKVVAASASGLNRVVDRAFWRCVQLIAVLAIATLLIMLAYRYISARIQPSLSSR